MFSVFGMEGQVLCCEGSQCGHYLHSWYPGSSSELQAGLEQQLEEQQQVVVKYPPCQQSNIAVRHHTETETIAFIVILLLYF